MFCLHLVLIMMKTKMIKLLSLSKRKKSYVPVVTLSATDNQKLLKRLSKGLKDQVIGINIKQKRGIKIQQMNIDIFSNQTLLKLIDYLH